MIGQIYCSFHRLHKLTVRHMRLLTDYITGDQGHRTQTISSCNMAAGEQLQLQRIGRTQCNDEIRRC